MSPNPFLHRRWGLETRLLATWLHKADHHITHQPAHASDIPLLEVYSVVLLSVFIQLLQCQILWIYMLLLILYCWYIFADWNVQFTYVLENISAWLNCIIVQIRVSYISTAIFWWWSIWYRGWWWWRRRYNRIPRSMLCVPGLFVYEVLMVCPVLHKA